MKGSPFRSASPAHEADALQKRGDIVDGEHGILAAEPDVRERPPHAFLGGARVIPSTSWSDSCK
jgi:hypothetical protein